MLGRSWLQTAGRSGRPYRRQRSASSSWTQGVPAGLPLGMPGIGELIDGALQQAAQAGRHSMAAMLSLRYTNPIPGRHPWRDNLNEIHSRWSVFDMAKSATFGVIHLGIAFSVGYLLTGSVAVAGAITVVEPIANTIAHYFFDRWWERRRERSGRGGGAEPAGALTGTAS